MGGVPCRAPVIYEPSKTDHPSYAGCKLELLKRWRGSHERLLTRNSNHSCYPSRAAWRLGPGVAMNQPPVHEIPNANGQGNDA
jgi:hypothetical protein